MIKLKKLATIVGVLGSLGSVGALMIPEKAQSQSTAGNNSPIISGNGNNVSYNSGFPSLETIRAQRPNISDEQYRAIKVGMTYQELMDIVKIPGREAANNGRVVVYTWGTELYVYMVVTMMDGKVQSKSQ